MSERGQTLPDFVVGIAVFLLTVAFLTMLIPQLAAPYDGQEGPAVAERIASDLQRSQLTADTTATAVNETCTLAFFNREVVDGCPDSAQPLEDQLAIPAGDRVTVTLRDGVGGDVLCDEGDSIDACSTGEPLVVGDEPPVETNTVSTARVGVSIDGEPAVLEVEVW